jgi:hypothetical protein
VNFNARLKHLLTINGTAACDRYTLWIDGVGAYLLFLQDSVTFGGPARDDEPADVALLANLSRKHATIIRGGEGYLLQAQGPVQVAGRTVDDRAYLSHNSHIRLGHNVALRFRMPSALSATARLDFVSDHRPTQSVDGIILMEDTCLLGPGPDNHVTCPEWSESVVLFRKADELRCKSRGDIFVNGKLVKDAAGAVVQSGDIVTGVDLRFRLEATE